MHVSSVPAEDTCRETGRSCMTSNINSKKGTSWADGLTISSVGENFQNLQALNPSALSDNSRLHWSMATAHQWECLACFRARVVDLHQSSFPPATSIIKCWQVKGHTVDWEKDRLALTITRTLTVGFSLLIEKGAQQAGDKVVLEVTQTSFLECVE